MTIRATYLLRCPCGAPVLEMERRADGRFDANILSKNHGVMRVEFSGIRAVCHRCKRTILVGPEQVDAGMLHSMVFYS